MTNCATVYYSRRDDGSVPSRAKRYARSDADFASFTTYGVASRNAHSLLRVGERHVLEELSLVARLPQRVEATVHDLVGGTFGGGMRLRSVERTD